MEDRSLLLLLEGEPDQALEGILQKYGGLMHTVAYSILKNPQDTEECMADALVKLWKTRDRLPRQSIRPKRRLLRVGALAAALAVALSVTVAAVVAYSKSTRLMQAQWEMAGGQETEADASMSPEQLASAQESGEAIAVAFYLKNGEKVPDFGYIGYNHDGVTEYVIPWVAKDPTQMGEMRVYRAGTEQSLSLIPISQD